MRRVVGLGYPTVAIHVNINALPFNRDSTRETEFSLGIMNL